MTLRIGTAAGKPFALPEDAVTQTFGVLAKRGVGKTHTASVITEEMVRAGHQVIVLDPLDVWWGLRSSADGKAPGLPVYVFGGEHGDLPLDAAAGGLMADVVVEQGISLVLSLRHLSKTAQRRFVAEFAERLYHRKGGAQYRTPLHLVIDEADAFAPQRVMADTARMLGAIDDLVRRGRSSGIGVTLISQRAASLNKDVLTQIEMLIALRTISPQDRKALDEWIAAHDSEGFRGEFMASLASLAIGEAWVWSPGWLDVFKRVQIRKRTTFDSSFTPKAGAKQATPARLASVDLDVIRSRMASVVEQQEANDPKKLRADIARLTRELAGAKAADNIAQVSTCDHEREIAELRAEIAHGEQDIEVLEQRLATIYQQVNDAQTDLALVLSGETPLREKRPVPVSTPQVRAEKRNREAAPARIVSKAPSPRPSANSSAPDLDGPERRVLDAIAWFESIGVDAPAQQAVCFVAGYSWGGGYFKPRGSLNKKDLLELVGRSIRLTDHGRALATAPDAVPTLAALHERVLEKLDGPERRVLAPVLAAYPEPMEQTALCEAAGYSWGGGYFKPRGKLRTWGLIEFVNGQVRATDVLFPEGLA